MASELTGRGALTTDVMLARNWKTGHMVAHYSAGATAERGAVARYLLLMSGGRQGLASRHWRLLFRLSTASMRMGSPQLGSVQAWVAGRPRRERLK